ncbi:MAG: hypothetical protein ACI9ND_002155 [Yoonia sp.]
MDLAFSILGFDAIAGVCEVSEAFDAPPVFLTALAAIERHLKHALSSHAAL